MSAPCPRVPLTLGVTGHRNLLPAEQPVIEERLRNLFGELARRFPETPLRLLSPLAEGADQLAARVARDMGIEIVVPLPFAFERYAEDFGTEAALAEFHALAKDSARVELYHTDDGNALDSGASTRALAYARLGMYISDHCEILIALWDGKPGLGVGGTAAVVDYHQFGDMEGTSSGQSSARSLAEDDTDLVYHIVCSRQCADGEPAAGLLPGSTRWLVADPDRIEVADIPATMAAMIRRTGDLNADVARLASAIGPTGAALPGWDDAFASHPDIAKTAAFFAATDSLANHFSRRHRATLKTLYLFAVLMGASFIAYADLESGPMIFSFQLLFFAGFALYRWANRQQWHRKFLDYRALAEGLRVQFYWRLAGASGGLRNDFAYDNFLQKQDVEIGWIRNVMRFAGTPEGDNLCDDRLLDTVIALWVGTPGGRGQLGYFESRYASHRRHVGATSRLIGTCMWSSLAITVVLVVFEAVLPEAAVILLVAAMGLLPLIAAVRGAYAHKVAEKELLKQYHFMLRLYREARFRLSRCKTAEQKRQILRAVGEAALDEHAEWILVHRERPLEPGKL